MHKNYEHPLRLCAFTTKKTIFNKPLIILILSVFLASSIHAENNYTIDSLVSLLETASDDSVKAKIQLQLCEKLAKNESSKAKDYGLKALAYFQKVKDKKNVANALCNVAYACQNSGEYEQAIDNNLRALTIYEALDLESPGDTGNMKSLSYVHNKLGAVYYYLANFNKALEYWHRSLQYAVEIEDKEGQAYLLNNIGLIFEKQEKYDSALVNHQQSLKIKEELNDRYGISASINNIGNVYYFKKEFPKAIEYWKLALKIKEEINEKAGISNSLQNIGYGYYEMKQYAKALEYIHKGLNVAREIQNRHYIKEAYVKLADVYSEMKNFEKAYEYQQLFGYVKDTLFNEESSRQMAELETKYQSEKKEKEIEIKNLQLSEQSAEIKSQRLTIFTTVTGIILLLALAIVILRAYKLKQKANLLLKKQKLEIEIQKNIIEEKNRDITDSIEYAKHIQDAILTEKEKILQLMPESFILFMPKDIVSGDFYWFANTGQDKVIVAAVDCTGHGVPGAFMSMLGSSSLSKIVVEQNVSHPETVLKMLNTEIRSALKQKTSSESGPAGNEQMRDGMDIALCAIEKNGDSVKLNYSGANRPLIYLENGELIEILPDKTAIGGFTDGSYCFKSHAIDLQKDTMIYLFSDGYADQFGGQKGKKFMMKNLKEVFRNIRNLPVNEQEKKLYEIFISWKGSHEQVDDVLVIGIRV